MGEIDKFLRDLGYELELPKPIKGANGSAYFLKGGRVAKLTDHEEEIKAANILVGKELISIANIFEIHKYYGNTIIIMERIQPLSDELIKSHKKYTKFYQLYSIFNWFINLVSLVFTLKPRNLSLKWYIRITKSKNADKWYEIDERIKTEAIDNGIIKPNDYMEVNNLGMRNEIVSSFDVLEID